MTYETHIPAAETAAAKRTGRDHLFRLLFCGRHRDADFLPAPVRFHTDHLYQHPQRSQRETNFEEYLNTLYSSSDYTDMLEATVAGGLDSKIPLSTEDYKVSDISLDFNVEDGRVEYIFYCDVEFYVWMFGHSYPAITQRVELTGYHNTKF